MKASWYALGALLAGLATLGVLWGVRTIAADHSQPGASPAPRFVEEAVAAGIDHRYDGEFTFFVGGGVAVFDCNADAKPDAYLAGGTNPASLHRNDSSIGGELRFQRVGSAETDLTGVTGAYPVDVDGDGHVDIAVLRLGENVLLRGLGECRFERANEAWSFDGGDEWTAAFSAAWEDEGQWPTLAYGNYLSLDEAGQQTGQCADNALFRPAATAGYGDSVSLAPGWCTLSILFSDWDRSGRHDLRIANDRHYYRDGEEQMWRIEADASPRLYTRDDGWEKLQIWGMGLASQDLTGDGLPEVLITSQADNKLQTLAEGAAGPTYRDIAIRRGVTAHRPFVGDAVLPSTAWHPEFRDINNDGYIDLYISKGNVEAMTEYAADDPSNLLLGQADGTFVEGAESAGFLSFGRSRGAALADFNLDGWLDLIEVNRRENVKLWRNLGTDDDQSDSGWVSLRIEQPGPNRNAVGAWVEVSFGERVTTREVAIGGGHASGQLGWIHFGVGDAASARVRVAWPGADPGPWIEVDANTFSIIERGSNTARPWRPGESLN